MTVRGRVLVVDDSVVVRRIVANVLAEGGDLDLEVAANASIALAKVKTFAPDVVVLDVEMPGQSGLELLPHLRQACPTAKVIMFSSLTSTGAAASLEALARGASDCLVKPAGTGGISDSVALVRRELAARVRALLPKPPATPRPARSSRPSMQVPAVPASVPRPRRIELVAIGASTGGPNALATVLEGLGATFAPAILIVQHMPPLFTRLLADRLSERARRRVVEARGGETILAGSIFLAPGDQHLVVERKGVELVTRLTQEPPENFCRPAVDRLFTSVASVCGASSLAVVLTGMGVDGARGSVALRRAGGTVLVQDEATSVVWGMPGEVVSAGAAAEVLPIAALAPAVTRVVRDRLAMTMTGTVPVVPVGPRYG